METGSMFSASEVKPVSELRPNIPSYKKKNNIWGSVLTEQDLTQTLVQSAAVDKPSELSYNERNVESYDFTKRFIDTRPELEDSDLPKPEVKHDPFEMVVSQAKASGSSRARQIIDYEDAVAKPKERYDRSHDSQRMSRKRKSDNSNDRQQRSGIHDRLGVKKVTTTQLGDINISVDMESAELSKKIAEFLHEPKVEIIERVIEHLGKDVAIRILQATKDVEETGGMYTVDGSRRRTPGGVYLTLIKQQPEFNSKVRKLIFVEDAEEQKQLKKEKKKKARALRRKMQSKGNGKSRSRSNSNSRSRSPPKKGENSEEEMDVVRVKKEQSVNKKSNKVHGDYSRLKQNVQRHMKNNEEPSSNSSESSDEDDHVSNRSQPFNFEEELAKAKEQIMQKAKSKGDNAEMDAENEGQDNGNVSEMSDLASAEADVVDIELGGD